MMTLEQIRERNRKENAAARRLQAAGYRLEGWDPRTGQRIARAGQPDAFHFRAPPRRQPSRTSR